MTPAPIRILAGFGTVGGWTMVSRVLGFLRDITIAALLGAGPVAEAFFVAFRLPNMFRRFFAEGAFNLAFIPLFSKRLEAEGVAEAKAFAEEALAVLLTVLIVLTLAAQLAMPWLVWSLASGFEPGSERESLAIIYSRICFPYIIFVSLAALFSGIANGFGRFAAAAAAPALLNAALIGAMWLGDALGSNPGLTLSWAVFAGGVGQLLLVVLACRRLGLVPKFRLPRMTPGVRRLIALGVPAALAGGVTQINLVVGTQIASWTERAIGWMWFADRIHQLPLGVVGIAVGVVLLPALSRKIGAGDREGATGLMNRSAEFAMFLTLPATAALIVIPELICAVLLERGAFTAEDSAQTARALLVYALGLPAFVLHKILQPAFVAREDMKRPLRYAVVALVVNAVVAVGLYPIFGWIAAPVGTTVAGWVMIVLLWRGARGVWPEVCVDARLADRGWRMLAASLTMGVAVLGLDALLMSVEFGAFARLLTLVPVGIICYAGLARLTGAVRPGDLRAALRRGA